MLLQGGPGTAYWLRRLLPVEPDLQSGSDLFTTLGETFLAMAGSAQTHGWPCRVVDGPLAKRVLISKGGFA